MSGCAFAHSVLRLMIFVSQQCLPLVVTNKYFRKKKRVH